jgi:galacturan 1,4-alpha-galacturonidase
MAVLTGALYRAHPAIRAWGERHEVVKLRKLAAMLAGPGVRHRDVMTNVLGINHFTFADRIAAKGSERLIPLAPVPRHVAGLLSPERSS